MEQAPCKNSPAVPESARLTDFDIDVYLKERDQCFEVVRNGAIYEYPRAETYHGGVSETDALP